MVDAAREVVFTLKAVAEASTAAEFRNIAQQARSAQKDIDAARKSSSDTLTPRFLEEVGEASPSNSTSRRWLMSSGAGRTLTSNPPGDGGTGSSRRKIGGRSGEAGGSGTKGDCHVEKQSARDAAAAEKERDTAESQAGKAREAAAIASERAKTAAVVAEIKAREAAAKQQAATQSDLPSVIAAEKAKTTAVAAEEKAKTAARQAEEAKTIASLRQQQVAANESERAKLESVIQAERQKTIARQQEGAQTVALQKEQEAATIASEKVKAAAAIHAEKAKARRCQADTAGRATGRAGKRAIQSTPRATGRQQTRYSPRCHARRPGRGSPPQQRRKGSPQADGAFMKIQGHTTCSVDRSTLLRG